MAEQAISSFSIIILFSKEPPVNRHSPRISQDRTHHTDHKQGKENMKDGK